MGETITSYPREDPDRVRTAWMAALERRQLASVTATEFTRALRALSSCYVHRRGKLGAGAPLDGAGKRAAFALFYGPLHFLTIGEIVRTLGAHDRPPHRILDLGCGTGVGGAAWALACGAVPRVVGVDRNPWAVGEANWTYGELGVSGHARSGDLLKGVPKSPELATLFAYSVNELAPDARIQLLSRLVDRIRSDSRVLIVESIALRDKPWWPEWTRALGAEGARADEWRFQVEIPPPIRELARRAGLTLRELTARSIAKI